jgi:murein L,D-transpeptidase YcbB/YkuD
MRSARFEHLLAGTAIALTLALSPYSNIAFAESETTVAPPQAIEPVQPAAAEVTPAKPEPESLAPAAPLAAAVQPPDTAAPPVAAAKSEFESLTPAAPAATAAQPQDTVALPTAAKSEPEPLQPQPAAVTAEPAAATAKAPAPSEITASVPESPTYSTASVADTALVEKLRDQLASGKFDRILGGKRERSAVEQFYAGREFAPLWIVDGALGERAKAAAAYLSGVGADGLDPADYPLPQIKANAEPEALAEAEIRFTDAILTYARHAMSGRVHYSRVSPDIVYELAKPDPANVLNRLAKATDVAAALDSFEPPQPQYKALKEKLAEVRSGRHTASQAAEEKPRPSIHVPEGKLLRPGMSDPRVVALRKRLDIPGDKDNPVYDDAVVEAVKTFQTEADIAVDGMLGANTVRMLNGERPVVRRPAIDQSDVIIANMERWRWMPRDLGQTHVIANIPDFTLRVMRDDKLVWKTKVVVGKPSLPTPLLSAEMKYITVNPTWNVPPSIIQNEYLPALQQDPQAMERIGLRVEQDRDGNIRIWQPPGDKNALGRIRFNFPNKFLVYQHDTPDKYLFAKEVRAYSHGCMRVENPLKYGEVLLSLVLPQEHYTAERLQKMFGGSEININFPHFIPVHLTYQTAFVDDAGKLQIRDDVYGRDQRLLAILRGSDRRVADIPADRPKNSSSASVKMTPGTFGGGGGWNGPSFFQMFFGGDPAPRPPGRVGRASDRRAATH